MAKCKALMGSTVKWLMLPIEIPHMKVSIQPYFLAKKLTSKKLTQETAVK